MNFLKKCFKFLKKHLKPINKYLKFHILGLLGLYEKFLLKTDKATFATLFNFRSVLIRSSARLTWKGDHFEIKDNQIGDFSYRIRHQKQCNWAYGSGIRKRAEYLADCYFLRQIGFKDGDVFFDCGANVGDLKIWFQLQGVNIDYVGFEPSPVEFKCLKENVSPSVVHNIGLWDQDGELTFYLSSQGADSSLIEPKKYDEKVICKVSRLEKYVEKPVKCLKLEAEGAEPEILEGLGEKISLIEYISADLGYERGIDGESTLVPVTNYLLARGFELVDVSHERICALFRNTNFNQTQH